MSKHDKHDKHDKHEHKPGKQYSAQEIHDALKGLFDRLPKEAAQKARKWIAEHRPEIKLPQE